MAENDDPLEADFRRIPIIETLHTEYEAFEVLDEMVWEVHGAAGIDRSHIMDGAVPSVDARITEWYPPMYWDGTWVPPLKLYPERPPHYKATLVMWCPPMVWPPQKIMEGRKKDWNNK